MALGKIFDAAGSAMAAQSLRLNTVASNLANVNTVSSTAEGVYQPKQAVFEAVLRSAVGRRWCTGGQHWAKQYRPVPRYAPDHPLANDGVTSMRAGQRGRGNGQHDRRLANLSNQHRARKHGETFDARHLALRAVGEAR